MRFLLVALLVGAAVAGCGPDTPPAAAPAAAMFPPYTSGEMLLLDDTFAPDVFGFALGTPDDDKLPERVQHAGAVERVRVATATEQGNPTSPRYTLVLVPDVPPLAGHASSGPLTIEVDADSPSYPLVRSADQDLVGRRFILMSKRYNDAGHVALHWRAEADTHGVRAAIRGALALRELEPCGKLGANAARTPLQPRPRSPRGSTKGHTCAR